jgi:hypothetical protein
VNYGLIAGGGMLIGLLLLSYTQVRMWVIIAWLACLMPIASVLFARHAKALYLAMDHYFDPHVKSKEPRSD